MKCDHLQFHGRVGMSFDQSSVDGQVSSDGATSIMLRRLPNKLTAARFVEILDQFWPGCYDFVFVPHDRAKSRNVSLAFVNFTDHRTAQAAKEYFNASRNDARGHCLGSHIRVSEADVQGLGANLAYFIAKNGFAGMEHPHAPQVFECGRRISLIEAAKTYVTMQLLAEAKEHMNTVAQDPAWQKSVVRRKPRQQDAGKVITRSPGKSAFLLEVQQAREAECLDTRDGSASSMIWGSDGERTDPGERSVSSPPVQGGQLSLQEHLELLNSGVSEERQVLYDVQQDGSICFFL